MILFLYDIFIDIIYPLGNKETYGTIQSWFPISKSLALLYVILEEIVPGDEWYAQGQMGS